MNFKIGMLMILKNVNIVNWNIIVKDNVIKVITIMVVQYFHQMITIHHVKLISNYIINKKEYWNYMKNKDYIINNKIH